MPTPTVTMLSLEANLMGTQSIIHPTLIQDGETAVLFDAGLPGVSGAMVSAGVPLDMLKAVFITHQDMDHIGGLPTLLGECPVHPLVLAHEAEKPYIQGDKTLIKITPEVLARLDRLPEEQRKRIKPIFEHPPKAQVDKTVADGETLPYCGGITVIYTPGHTPGHCCYYHIPTKTLIAGDLLNMAEGVMNGPMPIHTADMPQAMKSLEKLMDYDIESVICYHGGEFTGDFQARLKDIMEISNNSL